MLRVAFSGAVAAGVLVMCSVHGCRRVAFSGGVTACVGSGAACGLFQNCMGLVFGFLHFAGMRMGS